jgi:hypothetical protein
MSSDAATKLGLLAGQPANVAVVALKRPEAPKKEEPVPPPASPEAAAAEAEAGAVPGTETAQASSEDDSAEAIAAAATAAIGVEGTAVEGAEAATTDVGDIAAVPVRPTKPLPKPSVELGYFQQEANATATAEQITGAGMTPQIVPATIKGQPVWRLIVGPAATVEDRANLISQLKAMGFSAAKAVKG